MIGAVLPHSTEMLTILTSSKGLSFLSVRTFSSAMTTSEPLVTRPKTVCLPSSRGIAAVVMKNCEPLVLGPQLAIDTVNGRSCLNLGWNSSWKSDPQIDVPPVPSPI